MGKASSKHRKKSKYTERSSTSGSCYSSSNIGYVTKPISSLTETAPLSFYDQVKSVNLTTNYDNRSNGYSSNKSSSWCDSKFSMEPPIDQFSDPSSIFAKGDFQVHSESMKYGVTPRLTTSMKKNDDSGNLLMYLLNK